MVRDLSLFPCVCVHACMCACVVFFPVFYIQSKEEGKDQESIQSSTRPDPGHHMGTRQKHKKTSHTREQRNQVFPNM